MRILLLSDTFSEHTEKWALSLAGSGVQVGLFSFNKASYDWYTTIPNIELLYEPQDFISGTGIGEKLGYFKYLPILKERIKEFKPDILHAHYASSYGLIAALSGFRPFIVSVWGSDVFDFPQQNFIYKKILKCVLKKAAVVTSTSICMKDEAVKYTKNKIEVVPFGIDVDKFNRADDQLPFRNKDEVIIGNIKPLETKYGVSILIRAFSEVVKKYPTRRLTLYMVGEGSEKEHSEQLAEQLGVKQNIVFTGRIAYSEIEDYHKKIDIFVSLSILDSESFGVSLVEAMASRSCVMASNVAGFNEVLGGNNECGVLVAKGSVSEAADAMCHMIDHPEKALEKVNKARKRAVDLYNWDNNVKQMIRVYDWVLKDK
jgi:glycosyltransferase involved in cell wall biosynthesis